MAVIKQLKTFLARVSIYPKTLDKAVYTESGERLDNILKDTFITSDEEDYSGVVPRDADTLGGRVAASDFDQVKIKSDANMSMTSDTWTQRTYTPGEYAISDNKMWKCLANTTTKPVEGTDWHQVNIMSEVTTLNSNLQPVNFKDSISLSNIEISSGCVDKVGKEVIITVVMLVKQAISQWGVFGLIPSSANARPKQNLSCSAIYDYSTACTVSITTDGKINCSRALESGKYLAFSITYTTN